MSETQVGFAYTRRHYDDLARMLPGSRSHVLDDQAQPVFDRPGFWDQAACRGVGVDAFFHEVGENTREARAMCQACPVQAECLADCLSWELAYRHGFRGGLSPRERRLFATWMRSWGFDPRGRTQVLHGSVASYKRGCRCSTCKGANARYVQSRRQVA